MEHEILSKPAFEIINTKDHSKRIRIYQNGFVEGMESGFIIINRIPALISLHMAKLRALSCPQMNESPSAEGLSQGSAETEDR